MNYAPNIAEFNAPKEATLGGLVWMMADAYDPDVSDAVVQVDFFQDENGDGEVDAGELLGSDTDASDGWSFDWSTRDASGGFVQLLAVAYDQAMVASEPMSVTVALESPSPGQPPVIDDFTVSPDVVSVGDAVTFQVVTHDPDTRDWISYVSFFRDVNHNGVAEDGEYLGKDEDPTGGWAFWWDTASESTGGVELLAVAFDSSDTASAPARGAVSFTLDTTAPAAPGVALSQDTGSSATDKVTSNGELTLSGVETGAVVQYSTNGGASWTGGFTGVEGANSVMVQQTDEAGNVGPTSVAFTFTLDTTTPEAPGIALTQDTGSSATDKITSNGALTLSDVETGAVVQYSTNGGASWTGSFTAVEGANSVVVRQIDVAGNGGSASAAFTFTLDTWRQRRPAWR